MCLFVCVYTCMCVCLCMCVCVCVCVYARMRTLQRLQHVRQVCLFQHICMHIALSLVRVLSTASSAESALAAATAENTIHC